MLEAKVAGGELATRGLAACGRELEDNSIMLKNDHALILGISICSI